MRRVPNRAAIAAFAGAAVTVVLVAAAATEPTRSTRVPVWVAAAAAWLTLVLLVARARARRQQSAPTPETLRLFGEALAATHEPRSLLAAFLRIAVETTGAAGGAVTEDDVVLERIGSSAAADLSIALRGKGTMPTRTLTLAAPRGGFSAGALGRVQSLALQASAALTNAYLHELASERSQTDELTSLANRRLLRERLAAELEHTPLSLIAADLDNFKAVNDRYGHQSGDLALRHFAGVLGLYTREIDVPARVGGDEFIVLLPHTDAAGALALAERIRTAAENARLAAHDGRTFTITTSIGIATLAEGALPIDEFLAQADAALYRAKTAGRNTVVAV